MFIKPSKSNPQPAVRRFCVEAISDQGKSVVRLVYQEGPGLVPDEIVKFCLSLFASVVCDIRIREMDSLGNWNTIVVLSHLPLSYD